jgi:hypothetical protein
MTKTLFIVIVFVCVFVNLSCLNPFAPRLETEMASSMCSDLTNIDDILCAFRNAYTFKDTTLYGSLLSPDFTFMFTDYDRSVEVSWGRNDEMRSTYGLFQNVQSLTLIWNNEISSSGNNTLRSIVRGFNLTVTFNPGDIISVGGYVNLTFERSSISEPWKILRWRDESNF